MTRSRRPSRADLNFFGHQVVLHRVPAAPGGAQKVHLNAVDGDAVPVPHFGVALSVADFHALVERIEANNNGAAGGEGRFVVEYGAYDHARRRGLVSSAPCVRHVDVRARGSRAATQTLGGWGRVAESGPSRERRGVPQIDRGRLWDGSAVGSAGLSRKEGD